MFFAFRSFYLSFGINGVMFKYMPLKKGCMNFYFNFTSILLQFYFKFTSKIKKIWEIGKKIHVRKCSK